jgi:phenylacetic acid degradation operon negative regulatory protein
MRDRTGKMLVAFLGKLASSSIDYADAFLLSAGSTRRLVRNLKMTEKQYCSSMQSLRRNGYIKRTNSNQFLITPKGLKKARRLTAEQVNFDKNKWDSNWRIIIFDVPDSKKRERNLFRAAIKRAGFIGIQKSVFISPFADFKKIALIRDELGIAKYVTFLEAKISAVDDDRKLREKFELN